VAVPVQGGGHQLFLSSMVAYIGLNPGTDIHWVIYPWAEAMALPAEGKIDAYLGFPPEPQELRAKQIGRVIINTTPAARGPTTFVAWWPGTESSSGSTPWPPNGRCAPS
jgi:ABC-type nitrate/sulfonate/bicarbonate transport system substrate-binding protein